MRKQEPQTEQERNRAAVRLRVVRTQMLLADQAGAPESTEAASLCESCCHMLGRQRAGPVLLTLAAHQNHSGIPLAPPQRRKGDRDGQGRKHRPNREPVSRAWWNRGTVGREPACGRGRAEDP